MTCSSCLHGLTTWCARQSSPPYSVPCASMHVSLILRCAVCSTTSAPLCKAPLHSYGAGLVDGVVHLSVGLARFQLATSLGESHMFDTRRFEAKVTAYLPYNKAWIKDRVLRQLRREAGMR